MSEPLSSFAELHYGKSPAEVLADEGEVPVYGTGGIYGIASKSLFSGPAVILPRKGSLSGTYLADGPFWASDTTYAAIPKRGVDAWWLYYQLCQFDLEALNEATGVPSIGRDWLAKSALFPHDTNSQTRIARVLRGLDAQIGATEALIAKQERVRAGLMQDLFTRGVDENGKLRLPREEAPHLYHMTALGWLPKKWEAVELESMLALVPTPMRSGPFGSALLKHELVGSGVPFLGIDNIHVERFKADFIRFVTPRKFSELSRYRVLPDDVVITIMGTIGRCCLIPDGFGEMLSSKHLWTMTFDKSRVVPALICWQLNHAPWVQSWFRAKSQGGIMDAIQSSTLKRLMLPTPRIDEQVEIAAIYTEATAHLDRMRKELAKLHLQKSGLMQDLLTGKISVAPLRDDTAA